MQVTSHVQEPITWESGLLRKQFVRRMLFGCMDPQQRNLPDRLSFPDFVAEAFVHRLPDSL
jgi:hypothetical protein